MFAKIKRQIQENKMLTDLSKKLNVSPVTIFGCIWLLFLLLIDQTSLGCRFNSFICFMPSAILSIAILKSPKQNKGDIEKCLVSFLITLSLYFFDALLRGFLPFVSIIKLLLAFGVIINDTLLKFILNNFIMLIPDEIFKNVLGCCCSTSLISEIAEDVSKVAGSDNFSKNIFRPTASIDEQSNDNEDE